MNKKHMVFYEILRPFVLVFLKIRFGYRYKKGDNLPDNYIVLSNHVTDYDPLFVAASFSKQMYFVASEHIARWGFIYKLLKYLLEPIIRYKGASAATAVMESVRKVKKGANVCIFAEGVRTWDGETCSILPSTAKLIKTAGCGLVTYKITGGYFVSPMWSGASVRRGPISGEAVNVYTREQIAQMTKEELYEAIQRDLYEDAYARQLESPKKYKGKKMAEHLENLLFICPECGAYDSFCSEGNHVHCQSCGKSICYNEYGFLEGVEFNTLKEFSNWQKERIRDDIRNKKIYKAKEGRLSAVNNHIETFVDKGEIHFSMDGIQCGQTKFAMEDIVDLAMHGQRAIVFTVGKKYYELIPAKGDNALKFFLYYEEYKNNVKGKR